MKLFVFDTNTDSVCLLDTDSDIVCLFDTYTDSVCLFDTYSDIWLIGHFPIYREMAD